MTQSYRNAICLPCLGAEDKPLYAEGATGGVCTNEGKPIDAAAFFRQYRMGVRIRAGQWDRNATYEMLTTPMVLPRAPGETRHRLAGNHIFAGYLFPHYGHFLLESLSRLWFIKQHPDVPLVWLGVHNQPEFNRMNRDLFDLLGIRNPMHIVTEQTEVEELLVPEAGYVINTRFTAAQRDALRVIPARDTQAGKKVWLSRSGLDRGIVHNEAALELLLEASGWTIYHPEAHAVADQIEMMADAEVIAGVEGSALHSLLLFPDFKGRVIIFARADKVNMDYIIIADLLGLDQVMLAPDRINWASNRPQWETDWVWPNLDRILDTLEARRLNRPWTPLPLPLKKVTESVLAYFKPKTLVELWPQENSVTVLAEKTKAIAVSDALHFDLAPLNAQRNIHYFDLNADQFLTTRASQATFDLYCLRAQSDFGALVRAFNCSLTLSHPRTIWIVEGASKHHIPSANERLFAHILENYPSLRLVRVKNSTLVLIWRQNRRGVLATVPAEDRARPDFLAPVPILHINDIASLINDAHGAGPK